MGEDLPQTPIDRAGRRRARRRNAAIGGAAVAVAAIVVAQIDTDRVEPAKPAAPSIPATASIEPTPRIDVDRLKSWDPFGLVDEPLHPTVLPERLEPPADPPSVADAPMDAAVVAWPEDGRNLRLLGTDGEWRSVPDTAGPEAKVGSPALSTDGTRLAMSVVDGILLVDVTTGERRIVPWPEPIAGPWDDAPGLRWLPEDEGFLVLHWNVTWVVELDGEGRIAPYGSSYSGSDVAIDPHGPVVVWRWNKQELLAWQGEEQVSRVQPFSYWGERMVADDGRLAFTGAPRFVYDERNGPMVFDVETGALLAYAPIEDPDALYSDLGHLTAQGFLDQDTLLLAVGPTKQEKKPEQETWYLVAWHTETGDFERLYQRRQQNAHDRGRPGRPGGRLG